MAVCEHSEHTVVPLPPAHSHRLHPRLYQVPLFNVVVELQLLSPAHLSSLLPTTSYYFLNVCRGPGMKERHGRSLPSQGALPSGEKVHNRYASKEPVWNKQNRTRLEDMLRAGRTCQRRCPNPQQLACRENRCTWPSFYKLFMEPYRQNFGRE